MMSKCKTSEEAADLQPSSHSSALPSAVKAAYKRVSRGVSFNRSSTTNGRSSSHGSESESASQSVHREEESDIVRLLGQLLGEQYEPIFTPNTVNGRQITSIPHCRQLETWDCGVGCIQMILRWLRRRKHQQRGGCMKLTADEMSERKWILDAVGTESIWTIDIVIILQRLFDPHQREMSDFPCSGQCDNNVVWENASYVFFSKQMGCDETYSQFGYYAKAFESDETRVTKRFALARELNLPTFCVRNLDMSLVVEMISREECIAIALVDNEIFKQSNADYSGHYLTLIGISTKPSDIAQAEQCGEGLGSAYCLAIKNPAKCIESTGCTGFVTPAHFERAWRADGTDDDIIFIVKG